MRPSITVLRCGSQERLRRTFTRVVASHAPAAFYHDYSQRLMPEAQASTAQQFWLKL